MVIPVSTYNLSLGTYCNSTKRKTMIWWHYRNKKLWLVPQVMAQQIGQYMTTDSDHQYGVPVHIITSVQNEWTWNCGSISGRTRKFFPPLKHPYWLWAWWASYLIGKPPLGINGWVMKLNTHLLLILRLNVCEAAYVHPQYDFTGMLYLYRLINLNTANWCYWWQELNMNAKISLVTKYDVF